MKRSVFWAGGAVIIAVLLVVVIFAINRPKDKTVVTPEAAPANNTTNEQPSTTVPTIGDEQSNDADVEIKNFAFSPAGLTVKVGTTVTWTNNDQVAHTVTVDEANEADPDFADSGSINPGETYSYTFTQAGTYDYHCTPHPMMKASVTVIE
jgi:amicyanin